MNKHFSLALLLLLIITSCSSRKKFTYINDLNNNELLQGLPPEAPTYKIKSNDNLYIDIQTLNPEINILFNPSKGSGYSSGTSQNYGELTGQYLNGFQVDMEGFVTMPILGKVNVLDKKISEAQTIIQERANKYIKDATIKVKLLNYKYTVLGEINQPGVYYNYNNYITIFDAISSASGETDYSDIRQALVIRQTEKGTKTFRINLTSGKDVLNSEAYYIQPNDVIYIEPGKNKPLKVNSTLYSLIFSSISSLILLLNYID